MYSIRVQRKRTIANSNCCRDAETYIMKNETAFYAHLILANVWGTGDSPNKYIYAALFLIIAVLILIYDIFSKKP